MKTKLLESNNLHKRLMSLGHLRLLHSKSACEVFYGPVVGEGRLWTRTTLKKSPQNRCRRRAGPPLMRAFPNSDRNHYFTTINKGEKRTLIQIMEAAWLPADRTMLVGSIKTIIRLPSPHV